MTNCNRCGTQITKWEWFKYDTKCKLCDRAIELEDKIDNEEIRQNWIRRRDALLARYNNVEEVKK